MAKNVLLSPRGVYYGCSGILAMLATAHTSLQGFWWLINPVASGVLARVRRLALDYSCIAAAAANSRITVERITFTGTASALITGIQRTSADQAPACKLLSATTGLTPATVGSNAPLYTSWAPTVITAAGVLVPVQDLWTPRDEDSMIVLAAGEGIVVRQPDNGVTSDPRKLAVTCEWEEW